MSEEIFQNIHFLKINLFIIMLMFTGEGGPQPQDKISQDRKTQK